MPVNPTYPGVYIEEVPSGVRTITGVATSITAFVGRAKRGPVDEPITINSFGDFERTFGGLWSDGPMSYTIRDFFLNGGGQGVVVRLFRPNFASEEDHEKALAAAKEVADAATGNAASEAATNARTKADEFTSDVEKTAADIVAKKAESAALLNGATPESVQEAAQAAVNEEAAPKTKMYLKLGTIKLEAMSPGAWGGGLRATIDNKVSQEVADDLGLPISELFNLTVEDSYEGVQEAFLNVTIAESSRRIDRVLEQGSNLVRWSGEFPNGATVPTEEKLHDYNYPQKVDH